TVTALFADIKRSMELIEHLDPEEARAIVDPALKLMINSVNHYAGYVAQSTGDGIFYSVHLYPTQKVARRNQLRHCRVSRETKDFQPLSPPKPSRTMGGCGDRAQTMAVTAPRDRTQRAKGVATSVRSAPRTSAGNGVRVVRAKAI